MLRVMVHKIICVAFPEAQVLDITGPLQIFSGVNDARGPSYDIRLITPDGGLFRTSSGLKLQSESYRDVRSNDLRDLHMLITVGGFGIQRACKNAAFVQFVRRAGQRATRIVSVCTGTFLLAEAGLITTERVATHWNFVAELKERFPKLQVDEDSIYIRDGRVWSSAGVTAGIDLALALVAVDWGKALALRLARRHVVFMMRPGGQAQFSVHLRAQATHDPRLQRLLQWIERHLGEELSLPRLAEQGAMSVRTLGRVFRQEMGLSPAAFVATARLEAARRSLELTRQPVTEIARRTGFGNGERLRRSFQRALGVSPQDYRQRFSFSQPRRG